MPTRRRLLATVSAVAGVAGLTFGSGAFTRVEGDRNLDLAIAPDDEALLEISPSGVDSAVTTNEDGVLEFDAESLGLAAQTTATVGRFGSVNIENPDELLVEAFLIRNNTQNAVDVSIGIEAEGGLNIKSVFSETNPTVEEPVQVENARVATTTDDAEISDLGAGDEVFGGVIVDTSNVDGPEEVSAIFDISAERTGGGES